MTALSSGMYLHTAGAEERPEEAYCGWTLRDRLELLAFDADAHPISVTDGSTWGFPGSSDRHVENG
jgi:hypothetical protein